MIFWLQQLGMSLPCPFQDEYRDETGTVVEVDFYNATQLLPLTDSQAVERALKVYLAGSAPAFAGASVRDFSVIRSEPVYV